MKKYVEPMQNRFITMKPEKKGDGGVTGRLQSNKEKTETVRSSGPVTSGARWEITPAYYGLKLIARLEERNGSCGVRGLDIQFDG